MHVLQCVCFQALATDIAIGLTELILDGNPIRSSAANQHTCAHIAHKHTAHARCVVHSSYSSNLGNRTQRTSQSHWSSPTSALLLADASIVFLETRTIESEPLPSGSKSS